MVLKFSGGGNCGVVSIQINIRLRKNFWWSYGEDSPECGITMYLYLLIVKTMEVVNMVRQVSDPLIQIHQLLLEVVLDVLVLEVNGKLHQGPRPTIFSLLHGVINPRSLTQLPM